MQHPPRPLREAERPWGKRALTIKEFLQLQVGSRLLRTTLMFAYRAFLTHTPMVIEHPAPPEHLPCAPCIWKLEEVKRLVSVGGSQAEVLRVDQCMLGAPCLKPTCLMAIRCASLK
eukprot:1634906-Pyramimonas_sp.AAC.1